MWSDPCMWAHFPGAEAWFLVGVRLRDAVPRTFSCALCDASRSCFKKCTVCMAATPEAQHCTLTCTTFVSPSPTHCSSRCGRLFGGWRPLALLT